MIYLAAQFECVDFLPLLAQSLIHDAQMVAHHAKLVFVAPLSRGQLILQEKEQLHFECALNWNEAHAFSEYTKLHTGSSLAVRPPLTCRRVMF